MPKIKNLSDLKPDPKNPRTISEEAFAGLKASMERFGDLSGFTFNTKTGHLIAAHQRKTALESYGKEIEIKYRDDKSAYIEHPETNEQFNVRIVSWSRKKETAANIAANNAYIAGTFTPELSLILEDIEINSPELFLELNLSPLKLDLNTNLPEEEEKDKDGQGSKEEWVVFRLGEIKTVIPRIVADLFLAEVDRVKPVVGSEEMGPLIECITANSSNTPIKSLV